MEGRGGAERVDRGLDRALGGDGAQQQPGGESPSGRVEVGVGRGRGEDRDGGTSRV